MKKTIIDFTNANKFNEIWLKINWKLIIYLCCWNDYKTDLVLFENQSTINRIITFMLLMNTRQVNYYDDNLKEIWNFSWLMKILNNYKTI